MLEESFQRNKERGRYKNMTVNAASVNGAVAVVAFIFAVVLHVAHAADFAWVPARAPSSDGTTIDQGIAYILMALALVLTYLIH